MVSEFCLEVPLPVGVLDRDDGGGGLQVQRSQPRLLQHYSNYSTIATLQPSRVRQCFGLQELQRTTEALISQTILFSNQAFSGRLQKDNHFPFASLHR